jgi:hypothetical protein
MSQKASRHQSCLVLSAGTESTRLWPFDAGRDVVKPQPPVVLAAAVTIPAKLAGRDWDQLVRPRLDVAWYAAEGVFLQILELPTADPVEAASMVELQLEKLSPLPVNQVVWSVELLGTHGAATTVLVVLAARNQVEARLAVMEEQGFVADRLEVALVRALVRTVQGDGLWLVSDPQLSPGVVAAAWHVAGRWQRVELLQIPADPAAGPDWLVKALTQVAWAAELDGWLEAIPTVRLIAPEASVAAWRPGLEAWSGQPVVVGALPGVEVIAAQTATDQLAGRAGSLVPVELIARNRQRFVDRLWLRGLGTLAVLYLVGVLGYMAMLTFREQRLEEEQVNLKGLALQYTNALALKAQVEVLEEQVNLRFAALDSWKAVADNLPEAMNLTTMNFVRGKTLRVDGTAEDSARAEVLKFNSELAKVKARDVFLFSKVKAPRIDTRPGGKVSWSFEADLNLTEAR